MAAIPPQLIGESPEFHALLDWVSDIASLNIPILVLGEAGVGKEMIASRLHFLSQRWEQGYYSINCAAFDADKVETQLFGDGHRDGILIEAEGGTLFIDNIETLPASILERIVHMVEYGEFDPGDGSGQQTVDVRFVFSANPEIIVRMRNRVEFSGFLRRISGDLVHIEPLRDRKADITPLMLHFGRKMVSRLGAEQFPGFTPEALETLLAYDWPGNVRELKNVVERSTARAFLADSALPTPIADVVFSPFAKTFKSSEQKSKAVLVDSEYFSDTPETSDQSLTEEIEKVPPSTQFTERVMVFERGLIDEAMHINHHHQGNAAEYLSLSYHQFRGLLRKHGLKK